MQRDHRETITAMKAEIPRLRRFARYMTRDADYSDDLVQECLARAIANIESWQPGTNLRAWLFVILKNVFRNDKRRAQHDTAYRNGLVDKETSLFAPAQQHNHLVLSEVQQAFQLLTDDHREVLMLIAVEGLRYEEAAVVLNISVGTVKSRLSRARTALRALSTSPAPKACTTSPANASSSRPSEAQAGIAKKHTFQLVAIPDKASPFWDDGCGDPLWNPSEMQGLPQQVQRMTSDHRPFVGFDHENLGAACRRGYGRFVAPIAGVIDLEADPMQILADPVTDAGGVFADAAAEHERIDAAQGRGESAQFAADSKHEVVYRLFGLWRSRRLQRAHVRAQAGEALETRFLVQHRGDFLARHALLVHEVEHNGGVELAAARAHWQAVERRKAHGRSDAFSFADRAHGRAGAEMGDDNSPVSDVGRDLPQLC